MRRSISLLVCLMVMLGSGGSAHAAAPPGPAWGISSLAAPTNFDPGASGSYYQVEATNTGGGYTDGTPITIVDRLPPGIALTSGELSLQFDFGPHDTFPSACQTSEAGGATTVTCTVDESLPGLPGAALLGPSRRYVLLLNVSVPAGASGSVINEAEVEGGGAAGASVQSTNLVTPTVATPGIAEFKTALTSAGGEPEEQAAAHPFAYTTSFTVNSEPAPESVAAPLLGAGGDVKDLEFRLPAGLIGNPTAVARCTAQQFTTTGFVSFEGAQFFPNDCPRSSVVGIVSLRQLEGIPGAPASGPVYNLVPPKGMPAELGFAIAGLPFYIETEVRSNSDYGITARLRNISQTKRVTAASLTLWGDPGAASHDSLRAVCAEAAGESCPLGASESTGPFLRLPTSCESPLGNGMRADSWLNPGSFVERLFTDSAPAGCDLPPFTPTIEARPTTNVADAPSGLHIDLHIPQSENESPEGLGEADLKDATVTLPPGLVVNPSSADGLGACSEAQVGYEGEKEGRPSFSDEAAACPDASKLGTVEIDSPLVDHPLPGAVYLARQGENPFGSLIAIYITVFDPQTGVVVKLPGKVSPDPQSGQLTATVTRNPQLPFEDFKLDFFEGARGPLRTPAVCGPATSTTSLVPWSSPAGATATPSDTFDIATSPNPGPCATSPGQEPNSPSFEAGTANPLAGAYSPFILHLSRADGSQEFSGLDVNLPTGLIGKLAGIPLCSDAALAAAGQSSGAAQRASSSCPSASLLGSVTVGAGAGPDPFYVGGNVYLAGPYKGAPYSLAIITPAVAGPFDLGTVVVRAGLYINPETAQVSVRSDPIPTILQGIPLDVRSIVVRIDRGNFTLNPTSCAVKAITGEEISTQGHVASLNNHFQVGGCPNLAFKPKLQLSLKGSTKRIGHPALRAVLSYPKGSAYANIARAQVNLPHSEFIDQGNLNKTCTKPVLLAGACPKSTVYGKAKAWTPLLDRPLEGNVYLVGGYGYKLPALVAELNGQIRVLLVGKVDSGPNKGIRNTFETVPDAPVEKFELRLKGGPKYSLLENSENLCAKPQRAIARFTAQNGKVDNLKPLMHVRCKGKKRKGKHGRAGKGGKNTH
jgi:hypothetical protein